MALRRSIVDRELDKFGEKPDGQTAIHGITTIDNTLANPIPVVGGDIISSWTRQVVSVSTTPIELTPDTDQIYIRIVPLNALDGNYYYGPDGTIDSTNAESFNANCPVEIQISTSVYIVKESGTGNVVIYRGSL
jgi:hypothetical protein